MNILMACEFSGIIREAFNKRGHNAWSCDLLPSEIPGNHIQENVLNILGDDWDLMIAHPPCTHLAICGAVWFKDKEKEQKKAIEFFMALVNAPIPKICVENPVSIMSTRYKKPDQIIYPWQFGHPEMKRTCLWLKNLPELIPTKIVEKEYMILPNGKKYSKWSYDTYRLSPKIRARERSRTFQGIANAMAEQWGE